MDLLQHRYYRSNETLMKLIGQWPYQSSRAKYCFRAVLVYINTSEMLCRIIDIVKHRNDFDVLLDCAIPLFADLGTVTVWIILMLNSRITLKLLNRIRTDWQLWARHPEVKILHEYAEQGQKINIALAAIIYSAVVADVTVLYTSKLIDALLKNGTEAGKFPTRVYYYRIDIQKYYLYVMIYYSVVIVIIITVAVAALVMLISYVQHVCGIFAALGRKLERIGKNDSATEAKESTYALRKRDMICLAWCIDRHNDAIEYANLIEENYTWINGLSLFFGMFLFNILGLQILANTSDVEVTGRSIMFAFALLSFLIMGCSIAQKLMDHSLNIGFYIYNNQWYSLSLEAQKLMQLMTMRCVVPCQLTAAKILILTMNTCGMTVKAGISYFTILRSARGL